MFKEIDADGNGYITPTEVVAAYKKFGRSITQEEAKEIVKDADTDGDGRINYEGIMQLTLNVITRRTALLVDPSLSEHAFPVVCHLYDTLLVCLGVCCRDKATTHNTILRYCKHRW